MLELLHTGCLLQHNNLAHLGWQLKLCHGADCNTVICFKKEMFQHADLSLKSLASVQAVKPEEKTWVGKLGWLWGSWCHYSRFRHLTSHRKYELLSTGGQEGTEEECFTAHISHALCFHPKGTWVHWQTLRRFAVLVLRRLQRFFSLAEVFLCGLIFFPTMISYSSDIIIKK